jgi:hypothetical protein
MRVEDLTEDDDSFVVSGEALAKIKQARARLREAQVMAWWARERLRSETECAVGSRRRAVLEAFDWLGEIEDKFKDAFLLAKLQDIGDSVEGVIEILTNLSVKETDDV